MEKQERVEQQDLNKKLSTKQQKNAIAQSDNQENQRIIKMLKAPPISMGANEVVLTINDDQRELCLTPNEYPFSAIGLLHTQFNGKKKGYGTAFIVKQNVVLTAAHNVYERSTKKQAKCVNLLFNIIQRKADVFQGCIAYLPKQYKQKDNQDHAREYDFAIIIVKSNVSQKFGIIPISSEIDEKDLIQIQGFPNDLSTKKFYEQCIKLERNETTKKPQDKYMFGSVNKISKLSQRNIYHLIDTNQGQSGSPILRQIGKKKHAIGVHTAGNSQQNWGVRITTEVKERIDKWIKCFHNKQETEEKISLLNQSEQKVIPFQYAVINNKHIKRIMITPDKACMGLKDGNYVIDNTNSNVCIRNREDYCNWLCSSPLSSDGEFVFTIKVLKLNWWIFIGVMEEGKKGEEWEDTRKYRVNLSPSLQQIWRPNEEQTDGSWIKCSCSLPLPKCPFQIECHVNRQQNTIAWHYDGKQQAKSILPKAWKTNKKSLCAIVYVYNKGDSVQMM